MSFNVVLFALTLVALGISYWKDRERTRRALQISLRSLLSLTPSLLGMTVVIGLIMALIPPERMVALFRADGPAGFFLISAVGTIATVPAPVAFSLAGSLHELGAGLGALGAFISTLTMVGIVSIPMEIEFLGRRFALLRETVSFVLAVAIGGLMGVILP